MTREQISRKVEDLAQQLEQLGAECTTQHFDENNEKDRALLYHLGEFCRHAGFQLESFDIHVRPRD